MFAGHTHMMALTASGAFIAYGSWRGCHPKGHLGPRIIDFPPKKKHVVFGPSMIDWRKSVRKQQENMTLKSSKRVFLFQQLFILFPFNQTWNVNITTHPAGSKYLFRWRVQPSGWTWRMVTWHKPLKHTEAPRPILSRDCAGSVKATAPPGQSLGVRQKNTRCRGLMRGQRKEVHLLSFRGAQQAASFQMNLSSYVP